MADNAQPTAQTAPPQPPELHPPPPPFGDPPLATQPTEVAGQTTSQPTVAPGQYAPPAGPPPGASVPDPVSAAVAPAQPNADPFADNNQNTAVTQPQEPPQHPDRPLPTGPVTQTPLYSEPTPILPPRPQPPSVPEQTPPPPRASFDQMPDHPAIQQSFLGRAQSPPQSVQHVSITPVQPQPVAPPQAPVLDANANTLESDPAIASLHAMFPAFDLLVIQSVLEASDNNKDLAIDSLLSMSDPEYVSAQTQPAGGGAPNQRRELTQTELDEEFARRLMLEEEQQARGGSWPQEETYPHSGQVPYQTYQPRRSGEYQRPSAGHGGGIGDMANDLQQQFRSFIGGARGTATQPQPQTQGSSGAGFQDQLNRFADTGKRTFNSVFNKVKQKMEEFDRQHPPDTQNMNRPPQSGHWSNWQGPSVGQPQQPATYAQSPAPSHPAPAPQSPPPVTSHGALNSNPFEDTPADRQTDANTAALPRSSGRWQYQPEPAAAAGPPAQPQAPATGAVTTEEPRRSIDTSRLGLLPKRPVSLMDVNANTRPAAAAAPAPGRTTERDSDEESLEYVDRPMPGGMNRP